jgi:5-methyltetrahydropteroyltriglutamate--homocysteine methyltransferase
MLFPTTLVGSYPQPEWLIDRKKLAGRFPPRVRARELWRVPESFLAEAQEDATIMAIKAQESAGLDIITDGEIRRESYSNRFATALDGMAPEPALVMDPSGRERPYPLVVGPIRRGHAVEVRDMEFLRANTDKPAKMTLPGPFTISKQMKNEFYSDEDEAVMDIAAALNEEVRDLVAAGADVIQLDEPWLRFDPAAAERIAVKAIDRALDGVSVTTVIHLCFGYAALVKGEKPAGYAFLPQLADSVADQVSIESAQPDLDLGVLADLAPKKVILGVINLADPAAETADDVARRIRKALGFIEPARLIPGPDCGMKYLPRETAFAKLRALADGASQVRRTL